MERYECLILGLRMHKTQKPGQERKLTRRSRLHAQKRRQFYKKLKVASVEGNKDLPHNEVRAAFNSTR
ncbi:hypothetical protein C0J52_13692 [Blattella germanica]|nr:hypothetical protein C0J52_13692 [Blattella germanica]